MLTRNSRKNALLFLVSLALSLLLAELAFRWMIFSDFKVLQHLRKPGTYSFQSSEDYWKLYYRFDSVYRPPKYPHPLLGWIGFFDRKTLDHRDMSNDKENKRPLLFYGDSFIQCQADSLLCFDEIINNDSSCNHDHFLFNYGVGGYGVDQAYLLFRETVDKFKRPFVVFSIMPTDMDRCLLSVRTGQKPYFTEADGELQLHGVPVDPIPARFFEQNPPEIRSYIYRRLIHSRLKPENGRLTLDPNDREKMLSLNKKIILKTLNEIRSRKLDYIFMIFDELYNIEGSWRADSLEKFFIENHIYFIHTGNLVNNDSKKNGYRFERYILKNDGHPTTYYNRLVCEELKKYFKDYSAYKEMAFSQANKQFNAESTKNMAYYTARIWKDKVLLKDVQEAASKKNISLDSLVNRMALYELQSQKLKLSSDDKNL